MGAVRTRLGTERLRNGFAFDHVTTSARLQNCLELCQVNSVHNASPVKPSLRTTYRRMHSGLSLLQVILSILRTFLHCSFVYNSHHPSFSSLFHLAIGIGTTPFPYTLSVLVYEPSRPGQAWGDRGTNAIDPHFPPSRSRARTSRVKTLVTPAAVTISFARSRLSGTRTR